MFVVVCIAFSGKKTKFFRKIQPSEKLDWTPHAVGDGGRSFQRFSPEFDKAGEWRNLGFLQ